MTIQEIESKLSAELCDLLYLESEELDHKKPFNELGLDSVLGIELIKMLNKGFNIEIKASRLYDYPTVEALSSHLFEELGITYQEEPLVNQDVITVAATEGFHILSVEGDLSETGTVCFYYNAGTDNHQELISSTFKEHFGIDQLQLTDVKISQTGKEAGSLTKLELKVLSDGQLHFAIYSQENTGQAILHIEGFVQLDLAGDVIEKNPVQPQLNIPAAQETNRNDDQIAIIGTSGRYPKSRNLEAYWDNISKGIDCVDEVPKSRWDTTHYYKEGGEKTGALYCKWLGGLEDIDQFDPLFFNISPIEAELMDPQHRIFLEECWKAIEDAGYNRAQLDGVKCGSYVGIMGNEYADHARTAGVSENLAQLMTGNSSSIFAGRLAYLLNLKGPAMAIDTACSSSLVAIHLACQALLNNEINMAVAGGVTLYLGVAPYEAMCAAGMLSKEGKCKTFDNSADGFVPAEGAGVVILKRLKDAIRDDDHIKGVIIGTGINQDGKTNGITAPSVNSQISLLEEIYQKHNINPETISYVEAHGTGTKLGDPIEVEALIKAFGSFTKKKGYCGIGSVKSNLGHTSAAAGIAGLEKILLQFKHKQIAPSIHYHTTNSEIDLESSPFYVNTELKKWAVTPGVLRRAALSSFGFSGTNAHLVVEEYASAKTRPYFSTEPAVILLSAKNKERLDDLVLNLKNYLASDLSKNLYEIAYTLQLREPMEERLALVVKDVEALQQQLGAYLDGKTKNQFRGNIEKETSDFLLNGGAGRAYINYAIAHKESASLAQLWVKGVSIDWNLLYTEAKPNKISLPTYPFARERYWIPVKVEPAAFSGVGKLHPLLHNNISNLKTQKYTSVYTGNETFLTDHQVQGEKILPGVAYLELARAAGAQSMEAIVTQLKEVTWLRPVRVNATSEEVHISLYPSGSDVAYEVYSQQGGQEQVHSQGILSVKVQSAPANQDLSLIQNRLKHSRSGADCYALFRAKGLDFGRSFQGIEQFYYSSEEALSRISLAKQKGYVLTPGILDSAIQTCIGLSFDQEHTNLEVPFSVSEVTIYQELPENLWSYARKSSNKSTSKVTSYDIDLLNDAGEVLLSFKDFVTLPLEGISTGGAAATEEEKVHLYDASWQESSVATVLSEADTVAPLILLAGGTASLADQLKVALETEVIAITSINEEAYFSDVLEKVKEKLQEKGSSELIIVCQHASYIDYGFVSGLLKTAHQENPKFSGKIIEIESFAPQHTAELIRILEAEQGTGDSEVRYKAGKRLVKKHQAVSGSSGLQSGAQVKEGGIYLITGGAGGLGLIFARHISKTGNTKLILTGRGELNEERRAALLELPNAVYHRCDVSNKEEVVALINTIRTTYGQLDGIIHSAGVIRDSFIVKKTKAELNEVLSAKITGTKNLDEATRDEALDFMVYFSSIAGVRGNVGQSDYASANAYLDNYADYRNQERAKGQRQGKTLSINWPLWKEGGMQIDQESSRYLEQQWGVLPLPTEDGCNAFDTLLNSNLSQGIVAFEKEHRIADVLTKGNVKKAKSEKLVLSGEALSELKTASVSYIRALLCRELRLPEDKLALDTPFEKYGVDSILINKLTNRLEEVFDHIPRTLLFEYQTLGELVDYFIEKHAGRLQEVTGNLIVNGVGSLINEPTVSNLNSSNKRIISRNVGSEDSLGTEDMAIVALGGMFSEAYNPGELWSRIALGKIMESAVQVGGTKFFYGSMKETYEVAHLEHLGLSQDNFASLNRQQQLIFSVLGQAMDAHAITIADLSSKTTGVFIGAQEVSQEDNTLDAQNFDNNLSYLIPNKISFQLNLKGPSEIVNTYCTSVYVALHRAIQSIKSGECDQAIIGGVNVISESDFRRGANTEINELLSIDKLTKSFCDDGSGFVRSEGAGVLIIKSLKQAKEDNNNILALIKGSSVNHGGRGFSLEAPNAKGIKEVIRTIIRKSGVDPATIDYVEAHGIANRMADAIELGAISDAYKELSSDPDKKWHISSIKPTVGHSELASGMASIIKAINALQHKTIPGIPGLGIVNTELDPVHAMILKSESGPWLNGKYPRRVALNGYAVGGVNAHIILEEYKDKEDPDRINIIEIKDDILLTEVKLEKAEQLNMVTGMEYRILLSSLTQEIFEMDLDRIDQSLSPVDYDFDSVKMIQFVRRINETLNLNIKMGQILGADNFGEFFGLLEREWLNNIAGSAHEKTQERNDLEQRYPVSEGQKGLWFIQHSEPDNTAFNVPLAFSFAGRADQHHLEKTLKLMLNEHPVLCAGFIEDDKTGEIYHKINSVERSLFLDSGNLEDKGNVKEEFWRLLRTPFRLKEDSLVRFYIRYDQHEDKTYLLFVIHHIVFDGTSATLFVKSFLENYQRFVSGEKMVSKGQDLAYFDFVEWEKLYINSPEGKDSLSYWREKFPGRIPVLALPYDRAPSKNPKTKDVGCEIEIIKKAELDKLKLLARELNVNLSVLLLSVFNVLLHKLSGEEDIVVLTPTAGRPKQKHEQSIGFYVNMMMTRNSVSSDSQFNTLVKYIKQEFINGINNAAYPFPKLISELNLNGTNGRVSNFQIFYAFQNIFDKATGNGMLSIERLSDQFQETEEDYSLEIFDLHEELILNLKYNRHLFKASTIKRHLGYFKRLLTGILENPNRKIRNYEILSEEEQQLLLVDWNDTTVSFPKEKTIIDLFEEQVRNSPEAIAVVFEDVELTYDELNNKANQLGHYLREEGIAEGSLVSICIERSLEMIIGILGVLKAGAAFIPVDPEYPTDRIAYMLDDSSATVALSSSSSREKLESKPDLHIIELDRDWVAIDKSIKTNPQIERSGKHLAYIIYTSGSTGKPKGVMIEHSGLVNLFISLSGKISFGPQSSLFSLATFSFDMSYIELFLPIMVGGKFVIIKREVVQDGFKLIEKIKHHRPTHLEATPSGWQLLVNCGWENKGDIKILIGGEALNENIKTELTKAGSIWNLYGPTETTIWSTVKEVGSHDLISVGKPIANTSIYILEKGGCHLRPIGVSGEICIGGAGLARGYLNLPVLTAEKFIPNPFSNEPGSRLYRTGDLARWLDDGNIEYIGRIDEQVKIRGYRIELGEIESVLLQSNLVGQAVVVVRGEEGNKQLVAYVVANEEFNRTEIIKFLNSRLPQYMVPMMIIELDQLPLTPNGKIDRRSLPDPNNIATNDYVAPRNKLEEKLAGIWKELLSLDRVGINDNFFELGGHSLLATRLVSIIQKQGYAISLQDIFNADTLADLATQLDAGVLSFEEKLNVLINENDGVLPGGMVNGPSHSDDLKEQNDHYEQYVEHSVEHMDMKVSNNYNHILLLGATGYLGIHLLHDLLQDKDQQVTIIIRAEKYQSAIERMEAMYQYYFEQSLSPHLNQLHILEGDITDERFGLIEERYLDLQNNVDAILNSAAYTKHYGDQTIFDKVNVGLIQHMIDFVQSQSSKAAIHHVSTMGLVGVPGDQKKDIFTELDIDKGQLLGTVYQISKLTAEKMLDEARSNGLTISIYRVSNLTFHSKTGKFQSNPQDNAFYTILKSFLEIGVMPKLADGFDVSCINWISEAVLTMMDKKELLNLNWQIRDPAKLSTELFAQTAEKYGFDIKVVDYIDFLKFIRDHYSQFEVAVDNVVLHTGILNDQKNREAFYVRDDLTNRVMQMLELVWDNPDEHAVSKMIDQAIQTDFFKKNLPKQDDSLIVR